MNLIKLQQKLTAAARAHAPSDRVPYAFEKRIMARLAAAPVPDSLALWAQALWRAAVPCMAVVMLLGVTSFFVSQETTAPETVTAASAELSTDFEGALLASVETSANPFEDVQ